MQDTFKNKVVLITGSSRGLGRSIAWKFARAGAHVVINYRKSGASSQVQGEKLLRAIQEMGGRALLVQADIAVKKSVRDLVRQIKDTFGRLDCLVLNAARAPFKPFEKLFERELRQLVETNYIGNIFCIQQSLPLLEVSQGKIVFISSLGSRFYNPAYPLGSMKAAMEAVVRDCAESLRSKKISVNGVCGGLVKTDSFKVLRLYWEGIEQFPAEIFIEPDEIAEVVLFLCGPAGKAIQGQTIIVDRGMSNSLFRMAPTK